MEEKEEQSVENNTPNEVGEQNNITKKNNPLPLIIICVIVLGIAGYFLFSNLLVSGTKVVKSEVKSLFKEANKSLKLADDNILKYNLEKDSLGIDGTLSFKSDYKTNEIDLSKLEKYKIAYSGVINKKDNKASAGISLSEKKSIIDLKTYIEGKDVLFDLGDLYNKQISTKTDQEIKDLEVTKSLKTEDVEKIINKTEDFTLSYIKEDNITTEKVEKEINGKKDKYKKVSYVIDLNDYYKELLTAYKDDEKIVEILANLSNKEKSDIKEELTDQIDQFKDNDSNESVIDSYLKGKKVKEVVIYEKGEEDSAFTIDIDGDVYKYSLKENTDNELLSGEYNKKTKSFTADIKDDDTKANLTMKIKSNNKIDGSIRVKSGEYTLKIDFDWKTKIKSKSQSIDLTLDLDFDLGSETLKATLTTNNTITRNAKVNEIKEDNPIDIDKMTEDELMNIYSKLMDKLNPIMKEISPSLSTSELF